jgi:hypothetical protein
MLACVLRFDPGDCNWPKIVSVARRLPVGMCWNDEMSSQGHDAQLADVTAIEQVKYRYLRGLDTKHWDDFADTLTEDVVGDYGSSMGEEHHFTNRADLVEYMRSSLPSNVITEHRVTHPEIEVNGDEATGTWYLQDRVIVAEFDFMLMGAGFYHDRYRRTADGWRISATGYDRTYDATLSLKNLDFKITPGCALAL